MSKLYVGLAIADSMFPVHCHLTREPISPEQVSDLFLNKYKSEIVNCCNPSHVATLTALKSRHNLDLMVGIQAKPPLVSAEAGDQILCLSVRGLPRLTDRHEYTEQEIAGATFSCSLWTIL